ncbi:MAG TPA: hypothetical protein VJV78_09325 [Polyangiales bacterium]|nr:hypothetical protein [Polyangiales bacterium]
MLEEPFSGGVFGLVALVFFSTLAFRALQHALDAIFVHRRQTHDPRSLFGSIVISLGFVDSRSRMTLWCSAPLCSGVLCAALLELHRHKG